MIQCYSPRVAANQCPLWWEWLLKNREFKCSQISPAGPVVLHFCCAVRSLILQWFCRIAESVDRSLPRGILQRGPRRGPVQQEPKVLWAQQLGWGWRMCSLVHIWACNSRQNLRLFLISFILALTGLTPWRPPRGFLQGQRPGLLHAYVQRVVLLYHFYL